MRKTRGIAAVDRAYLRAPHDRVRVTGLYLDVDGPSPDITVLRARVRDRIIHRHVPALRRFATAGSVRWEHTEPDIEEHVNVWPGTEDLDGVTEELMRHPLPSPTRPLWDLWVINAPRSRSFRLCFRVHHGLLDGEGIAHTALHLLADGVARGPHAHPAFTPTPAGLLMMGGDLMAARGRQRQWSLLATEAHGRAKRWCYADVPESRLRAVAGMWRATVNDVFLAAVCGALGARRQSAAARRPLPADITATMPMSVRRPGQETSPGNHTVFSHVRLRTAVQPKEAIRDITAYTRRLSARRYRDAALPLYTAPILSPLVERMVRHGLSHTPLVVSHVTLPERLRCFGAEVTAAFRLPDLGRGVLWYVGLTRLPGTARLAVVHEADAEGARAFPAQWLQALTDLEQPP
ncbi:wax ester/triacylglycerol synthase domain-containing protein [Streptomyces longispororuber]|uniref:wax ester/triacylglycerol synthase domain-containing protein n=1 Tax=Streptomyces longispororuber TaxID=68230 RepID=UPI0033FE11EB